jgi:predicted ArsR family transcriptional regulator
VNETQARITNYLKQHPNTSAINLSQALNSTPANIRHHLLILQANGMVEICGRISPAGRGHPVYLYRLNPRTYHNNLPGLVHALLELLTNVPVDQENMLQILAQELARSFPEVKGSLAQRLAQAVLNLKPLNYEPRWEARRDGPHFMFANCPYAAVLADHPELCQVDVFLLEKLLAGQVSQTARIGEGKPGSRFCLFTLQVT